MLSSKLMQRQRARRRFLFTIVIVRPKLRDFRPDDFDTLWRLDQECFPPGIAYSRLELMHFIRRSTAFTVVAEVDKQTAGFLVAERWRKRGHIITLDVTSSARRHRVGSMLMLEAEHRLLKNGCDWIVLETAVNNLGAIQFYKRLDYSVIKTIPRYYEGNLDALLMAKKIANNLSE